MTQEQLVIWQAGFFDGEGCAAIQQHRYNPKGSKTRGHSYTIHVSICQKDPEPLKLFSESYGGLLYSYKGNGVTYWRWIITTDAAVRFLEAILPFSILKAPRIRLAIEFHKRMKQWNAEYGRRGYPEIILSERERYFLEMKALNQRGVSASNPEPKKSGPRAGHAVKGFAPSKNTAEQADKKEKGIVQ